MSILRNFDLYTSIQDLSEYSFSIHKFTQSVTSRSDVSSVTIQKIIRTMKDIENAFLYLPVIDNADMRYIQMYNQSVQILYTCYHQLENYIQSNYTESNYTESNCT
jgi:hypothetical protein